MDLQDNETEISEKEKSNACIKKNINLALFPAHFFLEIIVCLLSLLHNSDALRESKQYES